MTTETTTHTLQIGDKAPLFDAINHEGGPIKLNELLHKGKRVILYFYPKDNTPGCTAQACSLQKDYYELFEAGFIVIGVSPDKEASHQKFRDKYNLVFTLITDPDHKLAEQYNSWGLKKFMGREYYGVIRRTFIIGEDGTIEKIIDKVNTKEHAQQILTEYK